MLCGVGPHAPLLLADRHRCTNAGRRQKSVSNKHTIPLHKPVSTFMIVEVMENLTSAQTLISDSSKSSLVLWLLLALLSLQSTDRRCP